MTAGFDFDAFWRRTLRTINIELAGRMAAFKREEAERARWVFRTLQEEARRSMENLLTDRERLNLDLRRDMEGYDRELAGGAIDRATYDEKVRRRRANHARESGGLDAEGLKLGDGIDLTSIENDPGIKRLNEVWSAMQQKIRDSREDFADSFAYGMEDAMRGDWKSMLQNFAADALNNAFKSAGRTLFDFFQKGMGNGSGGWDFSKIGSAAMNVLGKLPGFANEGTLRPSGASGIDSQLVSFWKSPREQVDIYNPNGGGSGGRGGGGNSYHISGNLLTPEWWAMIRGEISAGEQRSNQWAATNVPSLAQSQTAKQQQHAVGRRRR